jgi:quercetin 2,3-dioxygenase
MPAITADTVVLPRIAEPDPTAVDRPVLSLTTAPSGLEGEGFPVRRAFAGVDLATLDPFIHMDQMGEVDYAPGEPKGTPGTPTGALRPSPTCSTGSSGTRTPTAAAG